MNNAVLMDVLFRKQNKLEECDKPNTLLTQNLPTAGTLKLFMKHLRSLQIDRDARVRFEIKTKTLCSLKNVQRVS